VEPIYSTALFFKGLLGASRTSYGSSGGYTVPNTASSDRKHGRRAQSEMSVRSQGGTSLSMVESQLKKVLGEWAKTGALVAPSLLGFFFVSPKI